MNTRPSCYLCGCLAVVCGTHAANAQHPGDLFVARTSSNQLTYSPQGLNPDETIRELCPVDGLVRGWTDTSPGFDALINADPENNVFPLGNGVEIFLRVIEMDQALVGRELLNVVLAYPQDRYLLGDSGLHIHLTWHIDSDHPDFDPNQCIYEATFVLEDKGTTHYRTSEPFTLRFVNAPFRHAARSEERCPTLSILGDFDLDDRLDIDDHWALTTCLQGPEVLPEPSNPELAVCEIECLNAFDFDEDWDVDLRDALRFFSQFDD